MKKRKYDDFDSVDDYFEEEEDENLFNVEVASDLGDVNYEDFNKVKKVEEADDDDDEVVEVTAKKKSSSNSFESKIIENEGLIDILSFFWTWFRRLGIVIAVILIAYYITQGLMKDLILYLLLLVLAFFFGYGFMAIINKVMENK